MSYSAPSLPSDVIAAIVREAATGASSRAIAARLGVSTFSVRKYASHAGVPLRRRPSSSPRPETSCHECGARCRSPQRMCRTCWLRRPDMYDEPAEDVALTGGRWVPQGGIQVWKESA